MRAINAVKQNYLPIEEVLALLEDLRLMVNDHARTGLKESITSMGRLTKTPASKNP